MPIKEIPISVFISNIIPEKLIIKKKKAPKKEKGKEAYNVDGDDDIDDFDDDFDDDDEDD